MSFVYSTVQFEFQRMPGFLRTTVGSLIEELIPDLLVAYAKGIKIYLAKRMSNFSRIRLSTS